MIWSSLEARWKCRPQRFSALAGNADSVALVLTINGASLLNRPCQTMQCPAESRDEDMGLQWSLAVSTSYQWHEASILAALSPGSCQARFQWEVKKQKTLLELNKGWIIPAICLLAGQFISESPMVQSGRNVIILVPDCCRCSQSSFVFTPLLSHSCLVCRPCCFHFPSI